MPLPLCRGGCSRSSTSFNFFRSDEIAFLYTLNVYDFYGPYFSFSVGNRQEELEDLHHVEEITGKSKFFLTV